VVPQRRENEQRGRSFLEPRKEPKEALLYHFCCGVKRATSTEHRSRAGRLRRPGVRKAHAKSPGSDPKMNLFILGSDPGLFLCPGADLQPFKYLAQTSLFAVFPSFAGMGPGGWPPGAELEAAEASDVSRTIPVYSFRFKSLTLSRSTSLTGRITFFSGMGAPCSCRMIISVARMPFCSASW